MIVLGFDIGGTKSAVVLAREADDKIILLDRVEIQTTSNWEKVIDELIEKGKNLLHMFHIDDEYKIGISCGGPLDNKKGIIKSPPNLPGWDNVPIVEYIYKRLGVKPKLQNDADACALAEWKYGAGKGYKNVIFLTFGTGLGAGLILNGQLYTGASNMAGEIGHIRLEEEGPTGKNKGIKASFIKSSIKNISTRDVAEAAHKGYPDALEVLRISGGYFGKGLSILIDILNPEVIIVGSVYVRVGKFLNDSMYKEIEKEALESSRNVVQIVPAQLGEQLGDYGAVVTALV